MTEEIIND